MRPCKTRQFIHSTRNSRSHYRCRGAWRTRRSPWGNRRPRLLRAVVVRTTGTPRDVEGAAPPHARRPSGGSRACGKSSSGPTCATGRISAALTPCQKVPQRTLPTPLGLGPPRRLAAPGLRPAPGPTHRSVWGALTAGMTPRGPGGPPRPSAPRVVVARGLAGHLAVRPVNGFRVQRPSAAARGIAPVVAAAGGSARGWSFPVGRLRRSRRRRAEPEAAVHPAKLSAIPGMMIRCVGTPTALCSAARRRRRRL